MKIELHCTYTLPVWSICALINADISGLNDEEENKLNTFENELMEECQGAPIYEVSGEPFFSWHNDVDNLGGDCLEVNVYKQTIA